jgi:hypothetical protein
MSETAKSLEEINDFLKTLDYEQRARRAYAEFKQTFHNRLMLAVICNRSQHAPLTQHIHIWRTDSPSRVLVSIEVGETPLSLTAEWISDGRLSITNSKGQPKIFATTLKDDNYEFEDTAFDAVIKQCLAALEIDDSSI